MSVQSILIVKLSSLGDILQTLQTINFLRRQLPNARIDWVVDSRFSKILEAFPPIDNVLSLNWSQWRQDFRSMTHARECKNFIISLRQSRYDLLIDLQGNCKSAFCNLFSKAKKKCGLGPLSVAEWPNLLTTSLHYEFPTSRSRHCQYMSIAEQILGVQNTLNVSNCIFTLNQEEEKRLKAFTQCLSQVKKRLMVCFGSHWENKKLSVSSLKYFLKMIEDQYNVQFIFVWFSKDEKVQAKVLAESSQDAQIIGNLSVPLWQSIMGCVDALITMDSSSLHLAATRQLPTFSFFGPSNAMVYKPEGTQNGFYQGKCPYAVTFHKRCSYLRSCQTGACLKSLDFQNLFQNFSSWWKATF